MTIKIIPCKFCGRKGFLIEQSKKYGSQIIKTPCIYCNKKGFIRKDLNSSDTTNIKEEHEEHEEHENKKLKN